MSVYLVIVPPASRKNRHEYGSLYTFPKPPRASLESPFQALFSGFSDHDDEPQLERKRRPAYAITQSDEAPEAVHP